MLEYQKIVCDWNQTGQDYPKDKTLHQLFEEQVLKTPDNIAVVFEERQLSYADLNAKANQLGRYLQTQINISPNTLIALCVDRSLDMIIGILGIMKAGGAYVPIDPDFPSGRIQYIIEDTQARLLLTQSHFVERLIAISDVTLIALDLNSYQDCEAINLPIQNKSIDLAYVIYTSGTTGMPKGAVTTHTLLVNRLLWQKETYNFSEHDHVLQKTPFVFDVSVWELLLPVISGSRLTFAKVDGHKDAAYLYDVLEELKITKLHFVPSMLNAFIDYICMKKISELSSVEHVFCSGEALPAQLANNFKTLFPMIKLHNLYGPTEVAIDVSSYDDIQAGALLIHIGKPIQNIRFYVLDANNKPVSIGSIGELHIGAPGLGRGYLNHPELTAEKFIQNPFAMNEDIEKEYSRLYKTGDLVRWLPDGNVEYIGRNDFQVKIRGYRIELSEIESTLAKIKGVKQACVLAKEKNDHKYLVAYVVLDHNIAIEEDSILDKLLEILPEYMVPSSLIKMEHFPLTMNGKLDRNAFPSPDFTNNDTYIPPVTDLEIKLCQIWQDVLKLETVGVTDDFFRMGGNSLLAIHLVSLVNIKLSSQIFVKDVFKYKTVAKLAVVIQASLGDFIYQDYLITQSYTDENIAFGLTNAQQAYLYGRLDNFEMSNVSAHYYSELLFNQFDVIRFETALNLLIQRHGVLRTTFKHGLQCVLASVPNYKISLHGQVKQSKLDIIRNRLSHKLYQVDQWPLFDYELSQFEDYFILHMSVDVLIMDGISMGIFFDELARLYNADDMENVKLPQLQLSFRDYMLKYNDVRSGYLYAETEQYWVNKLDDYNFDAKLPMVVKPSNIRHPKFARLTKTIPRSKWHKIEKKANRYNMSPTSVVLYAFGQVLSKFSGQSRFCVNLTLFNRLPLHEQVNDILGDFTVLELFNFKRCISKNICSGIHEVHTELWEDIEHNLFDGIDVQRLIRKTLGLAQHQLLSPVVLTSLLGDKNMELCLNGYIGHGYSISQTAQVYLDNKAYETHEGFVAEWDYVEQLFDPELIQQMHDDYCFLIEHLAEADWDALLLTIPLSKNDKIVIDEANSDEQVIVTETLVELFLISALKTPLGTAVIDSKGSYTYDQIKRYSYQVASYLYDHDLSNTKHLIGILSEKGYQQVVSTLGIMQSGTAYLPLHVDWPNGQVDRILEEGFVNTVLVSQSKFSGSIKGCDIESKYEWLIIEDMINYQPIVSEKSLPKVILDDVAYVIFTSGSTGKPKGVTISHQGAVNTIVAVNEKFAINQHDKVLALSELSFDLSVYDIFGILATGGTVVFPDQGKTKEPAHWYDLMVRHQITIWNTVPQLMRLLMDYTNDRGQRLTSLHLVLLSGDWIPIPLATQLLTHFKSHNPTAAVMSLGGATEGSIWSIWYKIDGVNPEWTSIPYGYAMPNQQMYVLNDVGEHCSVDVVGEIYIGGMGVALGYWNDDIRTQANFINHRDIGRLYKTGDLGKWNKNGYIVFQGRKDHQVKLNGYRVELEEITHHLTELNGIEEAFTRVYDNRLIAYLFSTSFKLSKETFDSEHFKLAQHGVRTDLVSNYTLNQKLDEAGYRLRKSYRQFNDQLLPDLVVPSGIAFNQTEKRQGHSMTLDVLLLLLNPLSAIFLPDKVQPKYIYPSGGSSYAIQTYLVIPDQQIENIAAGEYYYHPVKHALQRTPCHLKPSTFRMDFRLYLPAIEPLYGDASRRLGYLEMGHILYYLEKVLSAYHIAYHLEINDARCDDKQILLTIHFGVEVKKPEMSSISKTLLLNQAGCFRHGARQFDLNHQSIIMQTSELGQLLSNSSGLLVFEGAQNPRDYIQAGFEAQAISERWYEEGVGSCTIGMQPYDQAIYALAIGCIDKSMKGEAESQSKAISLDRYIVCPQ